MNASATVGNGGENDVQHQVNSCTPFFFCVFLAGLTNISFLVAIFLQKDAQAIAGICSLPLFTKFDVLAIAHK